MWSLEGARQACSWRCSAPADLAPRFGPVARSRQRVAITRLLSVQDIVGAHVAAQRERGRRMHVPRSVVPASPTPSTSPTPTPTPAERSEASPRRPFARYTPPAPRRTAATGSRPARHPSAPSDQDRPARPIPSTSMRAFPRVASAAAPEARGPFGGTGLDHPYPRGPRSRGRAHPHDAMRPGRVRSHGDPVAVARRPPPWAARAHRPQRHRRGRRRIEGVAPRFRGRFGLQVRCL